VRFTASDAETGGIGKLSLLELVGYDMKHARGVYKVLAPRFRQIDAESSRWRVRLSARYTF
jgi:hypothetical protein